MNILREIAKFYFSIEQEAARLGPVSNAIITGAFHGLVSFGLTTLFGPAVAPSFYIVREVEQAARDWTGGEFDRVPWYDRVGDVVGALLGTIAAQVF